MLQQLTACSDIFLEEVTEITVIRRVEIPEVNLVVIDGIEHNLGIHKDFKRHHELAKFIPDNAKLSVSWVRLKKDEVLDTHKHPIKSMVIVTNGSIQLVGEKTEILNEGDLVIIPANCQHGFIGGGNDGFWGLSVQFEQSGLYEDIVAPLVNFTNDTEYYFNKLIENNKRYVTDFSDNQLFKLMQSNFFTDAALRNKFLDYFQVFSNYFQRMMMNRVCFTDNELYLPIFELHLEEEFGHNTKLKEDRAKRKPLWDPILEATSSWFSTKMLSLDNLEKIVLVHLVVETSACIFYQNAKKIMEIDSVESKHFDIHISDIDATHANLGMDYLKNISADSFEHFALIQAQGWQMLNTAFCRIAQLVST